MPCKKCNNGKVKWGENGECKYDSIAECKKANPKNYNHMIPTPIGKKTYEEYEKELKEYTLSQAQRIDLSDKKTVESLLKKTIAHLKNQDNLNKKWKKANNEKNDSKEKRDKAVAKYRTENKKIQKALKIEQDLKDNANELSKKFNEQLKKDNEAGNAAESNYQKGLTLFNTFSNAIDSFYQAGKDLGVDIPTAEYRKALGKLKTKPTIR